MVTITVLAIIAGVAAPSVSNQLANQRVKSTTSTLANALKEARIESIIRRQEIEVSYDDNSHIIMIKVDDGSNKDEVATYRYDAKSTIKGDSNVKFKPNKTANNKTYTICDSNEGDTHIEITVSKLGSVSIQLEGTC